MNKILSIVVEGQTDALILYKVLPEKTLTSVKFYSAAGRTSLASLGRNILVHEGGSVLLIYDADTLDREKAAIESAQTLAALRQVAPSERVDSFAFVPSIDIIFFEEPTFLEHATGEKLSDELRFEGEVLPSRAMAKVIQQTFQISYREFIKTRLNHDDAKILLRGKQLQDLLARIEQLMRSDYDDTTREPALLVGQR